MGLDKFRQFIYNEHDFICNQKYANNLPYSIHLGFVEAQGNKFMHLLPDAILSEGTPTVSLTNHDSMISYRTIVGFALIAHDCIEDARLTYNNLISIATEHLCDNKVAATMVADIVYAVTDEKGKTRKDRKNDKYYAELNDDDLALFVKLSDLAANMLFSKLSGSDMYDKYKREWPRFKIRTYISRYKEFFEYIDTI